MPDESPSEQRKRWINIGEIVAVAGLAISGLALWNSWKADEPKAEVSRKETNAIPLALRGIVEDGGKAIRLSPVENGHALEGLTVTAVKPVSGTATYGGDPVLSASTIETWLPTDASGQSDGTILLNVDATYIERGETRKARQRYRINFAWREGGLFGGKSLRLTGVSRS
jgi:hypothetical protein